MIDLQATKHHKSIYTLSLIVILLISLSIGLSAFSMADPTSPNTIVDFPLDEGTGTTAYDQSGNGNNLEVNGASWVAGESGYALDYSNNLSSSFPEITSSIRGGIGTVSCWVNIRNIRPGGQGIVCIGNAQPLLFVNDVGIVCHYRDGSGFPLATAYTKVHTVSLNTWHYVVFTWNINARTFNMFIDGSQVEALTNVNMPYPTSGYLCRVGGYDGGNYFNGTIDDVSVFNNSITQSVVSDTYTNSVYARGYADGYTSGWNDGNVSGYKDGWVDCATAVAGQNRLYTAIAIVGQGSVNYSFTSAGFLDGQPITVPAASGDIYAPTIINSDNSQAVVQLSATPADGYAFDHWMFNDGANCTSTTINVSMSQCQLAIAVFIPVSSG